jgi:glyoxylase-like metal-dependent hydrolase (beta-lactamase superfamily II)
MPIPTTQEVPPPSARHLIFRHSAGHLALILQADRVLIAADICANASGLNWSTVYEDRELGGQSILKAAAFDFDKVVFGHGRPLTSAASARLSAKFASG